MTKTGQARILIIDDDESVRKSLKAVLKEDGYLVDTAENGKEAIAKSKANFYNLALIDLRLPDIDGIELLTTIRETTPKTAKIITTGYPSLENAIEAVNKGADGYLVKPYSMENLVRTIKKQLEKQREAKRDITERKRLEEELKRASQFVETILENANVWFDVLDEKADIVIWNKAAEVMSGYSREEVIGHGKIWEWLYPDEEYRRSITDRVTNVMQRGKAEQDLETTIKRKDGQTRIMSWNQRNLLDEKGKVTGSIAIGRDITERRQMEGKLRALHGHATQLNLATCIDEIVKSTLDAMEFTLGFDQADFDMVENGLLRVKGSRGRPASPSELPMDGPGVVVKVANTERTLRVPDTSKEPAFLRIRTVTAEGRPLHILSELAVPVLMDGNVVAVLNAESTRLDAFTEEDQILLETLAIHVSTALSRLRRTDALRTSELKYRTLFETIPLGLFQSTPDDKLVTANPALLRMLGYASEQELLAVDIRRDLYVNPEDRDQWMRRLNGTTELTNEVVLKRKDGRQLTALSDSHAVRDEQGRVSYYEGSLTDITERKRIEGEMRRLNQFFKTIIDNANIWLNVLDDKAGVVIWNKAAEVISGYSREEVIGHGKIWEWLYPDEEYRNHLTERARNLIQCGKSQEDFETTIRRKDSQLRIISWNERSLLDEHGKAIGSIAIGRDITERKQVEQMKDQFVSMVSHELRTPLTSIRASLGLLASGVSCTLSEKGQRMLEIAVTNTDRLVRLINDILDSERLASGKTQMEKKQCSAAQLVTQAADVMKAMGEKAGISLFVESQDAALWADADRIVQALTNLISNAIKFSPKGGKIRVTAERKEDQMLFRVQDQGRGIPPDKLGMLFERFQQVNGSDARDRGGSGLGLSISRSIIEQHNGRIWVESRVGKGSTFFFTVPLIQEAQATLQPEATTGAQSARRVLIIEDDPDLANILAAMLQRHGIQPHIALSGGSGVALSKQMHPDLIVLDLILPDMDGSLVVEDLRKHNSLRSVPLVVYTVRELDKQQRENLRLGETLFFTKSRILPEQFEEAVVQFMERVFEDRGKTDVN